MTRFLFNNEDSRTSKTIKIGGVYMPPLKSFKVQYYDIQVNSYRDISPNALLHKETIAWDKVKLVCEWGYLSRDEAQVVLQACEGQEFTECEYYDPIKLDFVTANIYRGDREVEVYRQLFNSDGSVDVDYTSLKVNFIMQ